MASNAFSLARAQHSSTLARVTHVLDTFAARDREGEILTAVRHYPAREAQWIEFPAWVHADLRAAYNAKGIRQLYTHQAAAAEAVHAGKNVVIVTPTASGKTLCYNLPVLDAIMANDDTRALYLFPTKALAQDQLAELHDLNGRLANRVGVSPTMATRQPMPAKPSAKKATSCSPTRTCCTPAFCLTTPDGRASSKTFAISSWTNCTPIAASSAATCATCCGACNVSRAFMAASPNSSAALPQLANPGELASRLIEDQMDVLAANGAPAAEKTFVFYNPPVVNRALGIRRSYINESSRVAQEFLKHDLQTMVFANSPPAHGINPYLSAAGQSAAAGPAGIDSRLSRRLSSERAPRNRTRFARGTHSWCGDYLCHGTWHRRRLTRYRSHDRLSRHNCRTWQRAGRGRTSQRKFLR